jgi:type IX secretion system PorP/SprF family membrane protein
MKNQCIVAVIILFSTVSLSAQSNIRLNNFWENTHYINPASTNEEYIGELSMAARQQMAFYGSGAPGTFFGSATLVSERTRTQWGMNIFQDKIGYTQTHDFNLSYTYTIYLAHYWHLHLGLSANYQDVKYDISSITLDNATDPAVYNSLVSREWFNTNAGLELSNSNWKLGVSGNNLTSPYIEDSQPFVNTNFIYSMYRNRRRQSLIDWGAGISLIQTKKIMQLELNTIAYCKNQKQKDIFNCGLIYRSNADIGSIIGVNISENLHISYCFDFDTGGVNKNTLGTHELMLVYRFVKQKSCHCEGYNLLH